MQLFHHRVLHRIPLVKYAAALVAGDLVKSTLHATLTAYGVVADVIFTSPSAAKSLYANPDRPAVEGSYPTILSRREIVMPSEPLGQPAAQRLDIHQSGSILALIFQIHVPRISHRKTAADTKQP